MQVFLEQIAFHLLCLLLPSSLSLLARGESDVSRPNIIFILSDDQGYNDISWNNPAIISPNLDSLAQNGIILENYYAQQTCTPSRAALMTGYYPIHLGRQDKNIRPREPIGIYTNYTFLPEYLNRLGYHSHMVGKWHLGFCNIDYVPTRRGFQTFHGFYHGGQDYYTHMSNMFPGTPGEGYDFRRNEEVDWEAKGRYTTDIFTEEAIKLIQEQGRSSQASPLFLYMALQESHAPLQVPQRFLDMYPESIGERRRKYSAKITSMDSAVGEVVNALKDARIYDNTLIIFSSDNGGDFTIGGNNFPLRGNKATLWEGGYKVPAMLHGPSLLARSGIKHHGLFHITDWVRTLVSVAGGDSSNLSHLDSIDQWDNLKNGSGKSKRTELLYNIGPNSKTMPGKESAPGAALRIGPLKLIRGDAGRMDGWVSANQTSALSPNILTQRFGGPSVRQVDPPYPTKLFNLTNDPWEEFDIAKKRPDLVWALLRRLEEIEGTMIPPHEAKPTQKGHPKNHGGVVETGWCDSLSS